MESFAKFLSSSLSMSCSPEISPFYLYYIFYDLHPRRFCGPRILFCNLKFRSLLGSSTYPVLEEREAIVHYSTCVELESKPYCLNHVGNKLVVHVTLQDFSMTKSHKQFGSRSASPLLCKDRASIRVGDLQLIFKDLLSAWKDSRSGDAALLEERMHLMLREWQAELNQTSPATSLQNDSGGSLSSAICRLFQLYKDEDDTSIAKEKVSAETGDTAIILCHWNGYICEGPEGIDYSEGVSQLIRVRSQVSYTELLDRIYSITEWDIASTQVNITGRLCTHTNPTHFIGTPICNDEALSALLEMYGARKVYCVELYLNSPRLDSMTNEIPPVAEQSTVSSQASYCPNREGQNESGVDSQPYPEIARLFAEHHNQSTSSLFDYRFTSVDSKFLENCEDTLGINIDELSSAKSHPLPLQTEETRVRVRSEPSSSGPSHPPGFPRVIVEITQPCTGPSCPSTTKQDADGNAQKRARRDDSASEDDHKTPKLF